MSQKIASASALGSATEIDDLNLSRVKRERQPVLLRRNVLVSDLPGGFWQKFERLRAGLRSLLAESFYI